MDKKDFYINPSRIVKYEHGLFTRVHIPKGTVIMWSFRPSGKSSEIFEEAYTQSTLNSKVNHSYTPNLESFWKDGTMYKRALRNIAPNEELTSNYQHTMEIIAPLGFTLRMDFLWFEKNK